VSGARIDPSEDLPTQVREDSVPCQTHSDTQSQAPRVAFSTLGCKLNLYETDALATRFQDGGYDIVPFKSEADVYVINSCTVTNRADRKSRNLLYRAQRNRTRTDPPSIVPDEGGQPGTEDLIVHSSVRPEPLVVLTGCFVDSHRDELESDGRTFVVPNEQKHAIYDLVAAHGRGELLQPGGSVFDFPVPSRVFHTRTMIKVQDGCDNFCTFCIIPFVRGRALSRPANEVVGAAREAIDGGAREIVLTGVNMSRYRDGGTRFSGIVEKLLNLDGDFRIRISSLEPDQLDDQFVDLFGHSKMSPHLHLCLQSASERILLAMRRQYTYAEYRTIAERLRAAHPTFNLTTDIIVGFPGETEQEFAEGLRAIDDLEFGHVHTFPYSERDGTRATRMPGRLPERVRTERAAAVREVAATVKARYRRRLVGSRQRLLVERVDERSGQSVLRGFGEHYVPVQVVLAGAGGAGSSVPQVKATAISASPWQNQFIDVLITGMTGEDEPALVAKNIVRDPR
jgi:threonylcarbamoyladenosine tRNA methylthiotransferase MtaB